MIETIWPDGTVVSGNDWPDLEQSLRCQQWHKYSRNGFRREMRRRAKLWAGEKLATKTAEAMFLDLQRLGMCRISGAPRRLRTVR